MKIFFENILLYRNLINKVFDKALTLSHNNVDGVCVSLAFASKEKIRALNKQHRNIDKATDVLSFPMLDIRYDKTKLKDFEAEREPNGELFIGDIVICKDVAKAQAKEYGHSLKREVLFLALHGLLHLLGYDHIEKDDEKVMMALAEQILGEENLKR